MGDRRPGHGLGNVILDKSLAFPRLLEIVCFISKCLRKIKTSNSCKSASKL